MSSLVGLVHTGDSISASVGTYPFLAFGLTSVGDSTAGFLQSNCTYYPNANLIFRNMGISGSKLNSGDANDVVSLCPLYIDPVIPAGYTVPPFVRPRKYIFVTAIGTNDGAIGSHPSGQSTLYALEVAACCAARKAAGFTSVGMSTLLPRTAGMLEVDRLNYNSLATNASWRTTNGVDFCVDLAAQSAMGNPANTTNPTYYEQDGVNGYTGLSGVHPTSAGSSLLATVYLAGINAVIAALG